MENKAFQDRFDRYYNLEKKKLASLILYGANAVLDLGCGTGMLGRQLLKEQKAVKVVGVEIFPPAAEEARRIYAEVHCGDLEVMDLPYNECFDYVVCGDILEHLKDPWEALTRILGWLKPGGELIASIPNIRYWRILRDLVFFGMWEYAEAGIMDRTHLRFFTLKSFLSSMTCLGFRVKYHAMVVHGARQGWFNKASLGILEEFLGSQFIVVAAK